MVEAEEYDNRSSMLTFIDAGEEMSPILEVLEVECLNLGLV